MAVSVLTLYDFPPTADDSSLTFLFATASANPGSGSRASYTSYSPQVRATTDLDCAAHPFVVHSQSYAGSKSVQVTNLAIRECPETGSRRLYQGGPGVGFSAGTSPSPSIGIRSLPSPAFSTRSMRNPGYSVHRSNCRCPLGPRNRGVFSTVPASDRAATRP